MAAPASAASPDAQQAFEAAVDALLAWHDPFPHLTRALQFDPAMCMARCVHEVVLAMSGSARTWSGPWPTPRGEREALHVRAAEAWCAGREAEAEAMYGEAAARWPHDALSVKMHQDACFFLGRSANMQSAERAAELWRRERRGDPRYAYVLGLAAFAAEENARYDDALATGREAVELLPTEQWAIHSVAHVYEMQCRPREGHAWLEAHRAGWAGAERLLSPHLAWHGALYAVEGGRPRAALRVWDAELLPLTRTHEGAVLDLVDATSLLLRLELAGLDAAELAPRYEALLPLWEPHRARRVFVFNDLHMLIAAEGARRADLSAEIAAALRDWGAGAATQQAHVARQVSAPLCSALRSWRAQDYAACAAAMAGALPTLQTIGGSHAQRDLFAQLSLHAAIRARLPAALPVARERAQGRQQSAAAWGAYAAALANETEAAKQRADALVWAA